MRPLRLILLLLAAACAGAAVPPGMVLIPQGSYTPLRQSAVPAPPQRVEAYYLDRHPVTNGEFLAFVTSHPRWRRSAVSPLYADSGYLAQWTSDLELGPAAPAEAPVVQVSWFAANAYAEASGKRLPTVAEWEHAAQAGYEGPVGQTEAEYRNRTVAWFSVPTPSPFPAADSGRPNVYGARGLIDLVWEWVADFNLPTGQNGDEPLVCGAGANSVRDFSDYPAFMRAAYRSALRANYTVPNLGFRCALSP